jgi:hypothetical protein
MVATEERKLKKLPIWLFAALKKDPKARPRMSEVVHAR